MARTTLAQLTAQLEKAHAAYEKLAAEHESLRAERDKLASEIEALRNMQRVPAPQRPARPAAMSNTAFREACARARETAMKTGRCVSVGTH